MTHAAHAADRLSETMDLYGWADSDDARRKALLKWMESVTSALIVLLNRGDAADELEAKLIEKGML